ncbi:unnamed protein product [Parajaminaea phylloscopi]
MSQLLLADLTSLSSESKRRSPDVRVAAEAALTALRSDFDATLQRCRRHGQVAGADVYASYKSAPSSSALLQEDVLLKPILLACDAKTHSKVTGLAVALLQRLVTMKVVPEPALGPLLDILTPLLAKGDVELLLKLLQTFSALLLSYPVIHDDLLALTLRLCFQLQASKVQVVSSTAAATIRQTVMVVFEKVTEEDKVLDGIKDGGEDAAVAAPLAVAAAEVPGREKVTLFPSSADAYRVLCDLNSLAQEEPADFLGLSSLPRTFTLELIESILTNHAALVRSHPELLSTLRQSTCPLLLRALSEKAGFPSTLRHMRLLFVLLRHFSADLVPETEILLGILLKVVAGQQESAGPPVPRWQRIIALEVTRSLCSDGALIRNLWAWFDGKAESQVQVVARLVRVLQKTAMEDATIIGASNAPTGRHSRRSSEASTATTARASVDRRTSGLGFLEAAAGVAGAMLNSATGQDASHASGSLGLSSAPKLQFFDQIEKVEPPTSPKGYLHLLSLQSLVHLTQSLAQHILPAYSAWVNARSDGAAVAPPRLDFTSLDDAQRQDLTACAEMARAVSPALCSSLFYLLSASLDDALFCEVLAAIRNWTNVCGALGLDDARDDFLAALSTQAVPPSQADSADASLGERNLAALRVLVHVVIYLSGSLDGYWKTVLPVLCEAQSRIRRSSDRRASIISTASTSDVPPSPQTGVPASAFQPGFSLASTPSDGRTGKPHLLAGISHETSVSSIVRCFENASSLADGAFGHFLDALCGLATASGTVATADAPSASQAIASVALSNLRTVLALNCQRVTLASPDLTWIRAVQTLLDLAAQESISTPVRVQAAEVLAASLYSAIDQCASSQQDTDAEQAVAVQGRVFTSLRDLSILGESWTPGAAEVRRVGMETARRIVETHGHALRVGWEILFETSLAACRGGQPPEPPSRVRAAVVKTAFATTQLVANDLLAALSHAQLGMCIRALCALASTDDVNVALTASSALWGVTAELANRSTTTEQGMSEELAGLWLQLLTSFKDIAADDRSDVRDAAISGLFRVLASYGRHLDSTVWSRVVHRALLPVVDGVVGQATSASNAHADATPARSPTTARGRRASSISKTGVQTAQASQQWQESTTLVLQELGATIADHLVTRIAAASDFDETWLEILERIKRSFLAGPTKVSQAAMIALKTILSVDIESDEARERSEVLRAAWASAWAVWASIADAIPTVKNTYSQANLLATLEAFGEAYRYQPTGVELEAVPRLHSIATYSRSSDVIRDTDRMSAVQEAAWKAVSQLRPMPGLVPALLRNAAERISLPFAAPSIDATSNSERPRSSQQTFIAVHKAAVQDAVKLYLESQDDDEVYTSGSLVAVLAALAVPVKLRYECPPSSQGKSDKAVPSTSQERQLWQEAVLAVCRILPVLSSRLDASSNLHSEVVESIWHHTLAVYRAMCEADCSVDPSSPSRPAPDDQGYDVLLLSTFERHLWPVLGSEGTPSALIEQFAALLARASDLCDTSFAGGRAGPHADAEHGVTLAGSVVPSSATPRESFAVACLDLLVLLSSDRAPEDRPEYRKVARLTAPVLLRRMKAVLASYTADTLLRGGEPLERIREEEAYVVLSQLLDLRLFPQTLSDPPSLETSEAQTSPSLKSLAMASPRAHLFALHAQLVDLVALSGTYPSLSGSAQSVPDASPPRAFTHFGELSPPAGTEFAGLVGHANVLGSRRLDREEAQPVPDLARRCLAAVSEALTL